MIPMSFFVVSLILMHLKLSDKIELIQHKQVLPAVIVSYFPTFADIFKNMS